MPNKDERSFMYKFVVNGNDWQVNHEAPSRRDQNGNLNNYYSFRKGGDALYPNIRHARAVTNRIH